MLAFVMHLFRFRLVCAIYDLKEASGDLSIIMNIYEFDN